MKNNFNDLLFERSWPFRTSNLAFQVILYYLLIINDSSTQECLPCQNHMCRKVTGIFTRTNLQLGYNLIARIPTRSCNVTVAEMMPSSNFLAVRSRDGYIINGNWAIVPTGRYMGAGTGFTYKHANSIQGETISTPGPIVIPVDIMVIYQSQNPGIKYEYWHPISTSRMPPIRFTQPSGHSAGKLSTDAAISSSFTLDSNGRSVHNFNRRRGTGITRRHPSFLHNPQTSYIPSPMYSRDAKYEGVSDLTSWKVWKFTQCSKICGGGEQQTLYMCTTSDGQIVVDINCNDEKPAPQIVRCNTNPCPPKWVLSEWSPCSVTCGTGQMTKTWACSQEISTTANRVLPPMMCPPAPSPVTQVTQLCTMAPCTRWQVKEWGKCSTECGTGLKNRGVTCQLDDIVVSPELCNIQEQPPSQELCHGLACASHTWFFTDWSLECIGGCENGVHTRKVWCSPGTNSIEKKCPAYHRPANTKPCTNSQACAAAWFTGPWTPCSAACGTGTRSREVVCVVYLKGTFRATLEIECDPNNRPNELDSCNTEDCPPHWYYTDWSQCTRSCGGGSQRRSVQCLNGHQHPFLLCPLQQRPETTRSCNTQPCPRPKDGSCIDRYRKCFVVQQARLCRNSYYKSVCCASCQHVI